jgi:hypothetical protein
MARTYCGGYETCAPSGAAAYQCGSNNMPRARATRSALLSRAIASACSASKTIPTVIYSQLAGAHLLSDGISGDLPPGSTVKILPWDSDGSADDAVPNGTVAVRIVYPYSLLINPFTGTAGGETTSVALQLSAEDTATPVPFPDFAISEKATAAQEIYQEVN